MAALKKAFEAMGFKDVRTVLASGNVIFEAPGKDPHPDLTISRGLEKAFGFPVRVLVRTVRELRDLVASDPFKEIPSAPNVKLYVTFLADKKGDRLRSPLPAPVGGFRIVRVTPGEVLSVITLSASGGTPELMTSLERAFGQELTTRNWQTVRKLAGV